MSRRKYSAIWLHFEEENGHKAKCKYCKTTLSFTQRSQSNLSRHLKSKHPLKPLQRHLKKSKSNTVIKQPVVQKFQSTPLNRIEEIDRKVLKMIAKGHHSFRLVEEQEFRHFIYKVSHCSGYTIPSWNASLNGLSEYIDIKMFADIKRKLHSATAVCLTIDEWTSAANLRYVAVTAHYINLDTQLTSHLLACGEFEDKQTSSILSNFIQKVSADYEIDKKVIAVVSDNSPNILMAIAQAEWQGIVCFAHTLNAIAQMIIDEIADIVNKIRNIVEYFNKNIQPLNDVEITKGLICLSTIKFRQDIPHKWKSTFEILKKICQEKDDLINSLSYNHPDLLLGIEDWITIEEITTVLMPFFELMEEISEEPNVTVSKALVLCNLLENYNFKYSSSKTVSDIIINLQDTIKSRFGNLEVDDLFAESIILDPRFKRKGFKSDSAFEQALRILKGKICDIILPTEQPSTLYYSSETDTESIWRAFDLDCNRRPDYNDAAFELDKYISEEYLDRTKNPLLWWKERKNIYPRVYLHALSRLCIVATIIQ